MPVDVKISAFVISCNRASLLPTCLASLAFADEVILVDKSSTDGSVAAAAGLADRVHVVPWSPTVEETRLFALGCCTHDWIVFLDDDECLSPEAIDFIQAEVAAPRADVYAMPQKHYVLGTHDPDAFYWPDHQVRFFRRGTVTFTGTVHGGTQALSPHLHVVPPDSGVAVHNFSHEDAFRWLEKSNRYTSRPDRVRSGPDDGADLIAFAHRRIDHWVSRSRNVAPGGYVAAVALLKAIYDMIDRIKDWEADRGLDGAESFRRACAALDAQYRERPAGRGTGRGGRSVYVADGPAPPAAVRDGVAAPGPSSEHDALARAHQDLLAVVRRQNAELVQLRRLRASPLAAPVAALLRIEREVRRVGGQMQRWRRRARAG